MDDEASERARRRRWDIVEGLGVGCGVGGGEGEEKRGIKWVEGFG